MKARDVKARDVKARDVKARDVKAREWKEQLTPRLTAGKSNHILLLISSFPSRSGLSFSPSSTLPVSSSSTTAFPFVPFSPLIDGTIDFLESLSRRDVLSEGSTIPREGDIIE
jgi:hypothetical protein